MMSDQVLICPNCGKKIPVTETLAHQVEERVKGSLQAEADEQLRLQKIELQKQFKTDSEKSHKIFEKNLKKHFDEELAEKEKEKLKLTQSLQDYKTRKRIYLREKKISIRRLLQKSEKPRRDLEMNCH